LLYVCMNEQKMIGTKREKSGKETILTE